MVRSLYALVGRARVESLAVVAAAGALRAESPDTNWI